MISGSNSIEISRGSVINSPAVVCAGYDYSHYKRSGKGQITIGERFNLHFGSLVISQGGSISIGADCSVNPYCVIYGGGGLKIGSKVRIATGVKIIPSNHGFENPSQPIFEQGLTRLGITIGDDVWIGANASILDGVTIGNGAVIGAGAVVNKDVPSMTVYAGVPAREISSRV